MDLKSSEGEALLHEESDISWKSDSLSPVSESDSRKWPEEKEQYDEINEYIRQVDEILNFIQPFPRDIRPLDTGSTIRAPQRLGIDHLQNLIKLVEQLKDLKENNSRLNERTRYLEDLKKLRERKKRLKYEADLELKKYWPTENKDEPHVKKTRSSLPFRKNSRGRSKSVNIEELDKEGDDRFRRERFPSQEQTPRRKSSSLLQKINLTGSKAKVSKWTKVKEAFRWEKASHSVSSKREEGQYLQVPQDKASESLSDSALSGQASAASSVGAPSTSCLAAVSSGYSGEHSSEGHSTSSGYVLELLPSPPAPPQLDDDFLSLPLIQDLSSSSSSEKLDELLTYSELLSQGEAAESMDVPFQHLDLRHEEEMETRRSKSLDGDMILGPCPALVQHFSKESLTSSKLAKAHKTPWGKVKDIIQTRKDSLKKKPKKRIEDFQRGSDLFSLSVDHELDLQEDLSSPDEKPRDQVSALKPRIEITADNSAEQISAPPLQKPSTESVAVRRLTPVLTITLPSTEELRNLSFPDPDTAGIQKPSTPVALEKSRNLCEAEYFEDIPKYEKGKQSPYHRRFSRWTKVKRAFLTSTSPNRSPDYIAGASSVPSSPNRHSSFFSDIDSDEMSSGEWAEDKLHFQDKSGHDLESPTTPHRSIQADIQKSYMELQQKLTHEFDQKIREWERAKSIESPKHEEPFAKPKIEDWDRIPRASAGQRESMAIPLPTMDDLSPEFKKKLDEWKKIKKSQTTPAVPQSLGKYEPQAPHFKMRIGEWQRWKPRGHKAQTYKPDGNLPDEFCKKLEEWQKIKTSDRRSRSQSDRGKDDSGNRTPSPRLSRKNSKGAIKKMTSSGKSSGTESLSGSLREKEGRGVGRKIQKEKDLQWLEKELHKIEREKIRLEREREKYLEREARLEQMKRTMGTTSPTQEVLIKTPTGFFRFEGISQKFTKKLYEWEKARGIAPEASTFALLEECATTTTNGNANGGSLQRSKSVGSVIELSSASVVQTIPHHPSSLSLNDVDELEALEETAIADSRERIQSEDEPQAIIVDVEDVVEETAALMADLPQVQGQVPVYSYAPEEVTQLIDSSGSESEKEIQLVENLNAAEATSSTLLIDHNMDLLDKLEVKESICRKIENDLETIEAQINEDKKFRDDPIDRDTQQENRLRQDGQDLQHSFAKHSEQQADLAHDLVDKMKLLDEITSSVNQEETVGRVHELSSQLLCLAKKLETALGERNADVKNLSSTLYNRRERAAANRLRTGHLWFSAEGTALSSGSIADHDILMQTLSTCPSSQELSQLPSQITNKVLELKCGLNILKNATETENNAVKTPSEGTADSSTSFTFRVPGPRNSNLNHPERTDEEKSRKLEKSKKQIAFGDLADGDLNKHSEAKNSPDVIKRKIKEKISLMQRMTTEARPRTFQPLEFNYNKHVDDDVTDDESLEIQNDDIEDQDEKVVIVKKNGKGTKQRKMLKARRITDTTIAYKHGFDPGNRTSSEKEDSDDVFLKDDGDRKYPYFQFRKNSDDSGPRSSTDVDSVSSAPLVNVFVPTTRKIISPVRRDSKGTSSSVLSYVIDDISFEENYGKNDAEAKVEDNSKSGLDLTSSLNRKLKISRAQSASPGMTRKMPATVESVISNAGSKFSEGRDGDPRQGSSESGTSGECEKRDIGIPPLPNSPSTGRKAIVKEAAPSIRMMIAKYNQKISEQEGQSDAGSGTASPVAWRSPVFERRVQDVSSVLRHGGKFGRIEVQKSASAGLIRSRNTSSESLQDNSQIRGILKSSSVGTIKPPSSCIGSPQISAQPSTEQIVKEEILQPESVLRALRIKRAKEEFLARGPGGQSWTSEISQMTPTTSSVPLPWESKGVEEDKGKSRLSHISIGSESSFDEAFEATNLIKSASAGMINEDQRELIRRCSEGGQEKVENSSQKQTSKTSKFGISSIRSRFRKVKMRKVKEKEGGKMNTVSTLCRQSLLLDVSNGSRKTSMASTSKSCPSSPVLERGKSWIKNPARRMFRSKDTK